MGLRRDRGAPGWLFRLDQVAPFVSFDVARRAVRAGRWGKPHRGIYVTHNAELTPAQERWVCLLAAPGGSALAGLTAAELDGLRGFEARESYVVIPHGARRPKRSGLVVRATRHLTDREVHPVRMPRRTRLPRSLLDAAEWHSSDQGRRAVILAGVQQRLVRPSDLRAVLSQRGRCRQRALIVEAIDDAEGGVASIPEHEFERIRRRFGLPEPRRQAVVQRTDGRYYLDAYWAKYGLTAEIYGIQHLEVANWDADLDRQAALAAQGCAVIPFSSYAVRHRGDRVGELLVRALRAAGWPG